MDITLTKEQSNKLEILRDKLRLLNNGVKVNVNLSFPKLHVATVHWNDGDCPTVVYRLDNSLGEFWDSVNNTVELEKEKIVKQVQSEIDYIITESNKLASELNVDKNYFFDQYIL